MSSAGFHIDRAAQLGPEFDGRADLCQATVAEQLEIQFLVHVYMRRLNLAVDRLYESDNNGTRREAYRRVARTVADEMRALDRSLIHFRTGPLIRLVLQGPRGGVFADSVLMDEYVMATIGLPADTEQAEVVLPRIDLVRRTDRALTRLADQIRALVGQPSLNLGGWLTSLTAGPVDRPADNESVPPPGADPDDFRRAARVAPGDLHEEVMQAGSHDQLDACREAVANGSLHYVALYRGTEQLLEVDAFEGNDVKQFLTRIAPGTRRELYRQFGREAAGQTAELARLTATVTGTPLLRVVFDVEEGAIFYYRVGEDRHLIGVTLHQSVVSQADDAAGELALRCQ